MFQDTIENLENHIKNLEDYHIQQVKPKGIKSFHWDHDEKLKSTLTKLKQAAELLSNSCVKLALLYHTKPSTDSLNSLLEEINKYINAVAGVFIEFCSKNSLHKLYFETVSNDIRAYFEKVKNLLLSIESNDQETINYFAGMITKVLEKINTIPVSNREIIRKVLVEKCISIKEIIQEFESYFEKHELNENNTLSSQPNDKIDDNEPENERDILMEETDFTRIECLKAKSCIKLIQIASDLSKISLNIMSKVCDQVTLNNKANKLPDLIIVEESEFDSMLKYPELSVEIKCELWASKLTQSCCELEGDAIDFASDLYPPFEESLNEIQSLFSQYLVILRNHLKLLKEPTFYFFWSEGQKDNASKIEDRLSQIEF